MPASEIEWRWREVHLSSMNWPLSGWVGRTLGSLALLVLAVAVGRSPVRAAVDGEPGLPSVEFILQQVSTNALRESANDAEFASHYHFVRWKQQDELDGQRRVVKSTWKAGTNSPTARGPVSPMGAHWDAEEAPERTNELRLVKGAHVKGRAIEKKETVVDGDVLSRFQFTLIGREEFDGRPVLALDFSPNPRAPSPRNLKERFMQHIAGRIWVDERTWFVAKLNVNLQESVSVVGGLAGSLKNLTYAFERAITPEGWWYTRGVDWELMGRAVFSQKHVVYHEGRTNLVRVR